MAGNHNYCCLVGNLTRDVEVRYNQSQVTVAKTAIAVNRTYQDKTETLFMEIVAFGKLAEVLENESMGVSGWDKTQPHGTDSRNIPGS